MTTFRKPTPDETPAEPEATTPDEVIDPGMFPMINDADPTAVQARMVERVFKAETIDDLFDILDGNLSKALIGRKVQIQSVAWQPYESDRGIIPLAVVQATDLADGEQLEFATTSSMLTSFIRRAEMIGAIPFAARIVGKRTRSGNTALNFERV